MRRARWGALAAGTALLAAGLQAPAIASASLDGPPKIMGVRFGVASVSVSGLHVAQVAVAVRLTDMDGVVHGSSATDPIIFRTPYLSVDSVTGTFNRISGAHGEAVELELVEGTPQDGWWQGQLEVGALDDGQFRVAHVSAQDSKGDRFDFADPAANGYDPRLTVVGSDSPATSAGWSPGIVTYPAGSTFKGRLVHRATGQPFAGVTIRLYDYDPWVNHVFVLRRKTTTDSAGYWRASFDSVCYPCNPLWASVAGPNGFIVVSNNDFVRVRWNVWARLTTDRIRLGSSTTVWGSLRPASELEPAFNPGWQQAVLLQRLVSGTWKTVATAHAHQSGRFSLTAQPPSRGYHRYRVLVPGPGTDCGTCFYANSTPTIVLGVS